MSIISFDYRACLATALLAFCLSAPAADLVQMQVETGKQLYVTTCANCHGAGGKGALGPPLVDRGLELDTIRSTMMNGRVGTAMPPFKDALDAQSQSDIAAYVLWLSSGGRLPTAVVASATAGASAGAGPTSELIAVGKAQGSPARGAALFFDATNIKSCRACHSYDKKGGPVGPDLSALNKTPVEVYRSISRANIPAAGFPVVTVSLPNGTEMAGVKSDETADAVSIFDVSSVPPIKRTFLKSEISAVTPQPDSGAFDHATLRFSKQDLLDASAYLGKAETAAASK
jgi:putative heme-binding domain-containing protein